jgi:hypothetical protein
VKYVTDIPALLSEVRAIVRANSLYSHINYTEYTVKNITPTFLFRKNSSKWSIAYFYFLGMSLYIHYLSMSKPKLILFDIDLEPQIQIIVRHRNFHTVSHFQINARSRCITHTLSLSLTAKNWFALSISITNCVT